MEMFDCNKDDVIRVSGRLALGLPMKPDDTMAALVIEVKTGELAGKTIATGVTIEVARALRTALKVFIDRQAVTND